VCRNAIQIIGPQAILTFGGALTACVLISFS
jgi:hypothetical protein